mmetsp:Transcript_65546/g.200731  ORF Transcript_65546/g.200731 Transcript_65546/m.200731 type:complete len:240 (-) Transcript_65546:1276-1995(-)
MSASMPSWSMTLPKHSFISPTSNTPSLLMSIARNSWFNSDIWVTFSCAATQFDTALPNALLDEYFVSWRRSCRDRSRATGCCWRSLASASQACWMACSAVGRPVRSLCNKPWTNSAAPSSSMGLKSASELFRRAYMAIGCSATNGFFPQRSSMIVTPIAQMSDLALASPAKTSGPMYGTVPFIAWGEHSCPLHSSATPKSAISTCIFSMSAADAGTLSWCANRILAGLRSRWITPFAWM